MSRYAAEDGRLVYVGNLPDDVRERDIDDIFYKYGRIRNIDLKYPPRPPPFCFVEFSDSRDAYDAVRGRDGYDFYGCRLRVELAKGGGRRNEGRRDDLPRERRERREFRKPAPTGFRIRVKNLPPTASWQDLKDFFRQVGRPTFADVVKEGDTAYGIVEFETANDMDKAIRLDDTEFRNKFDRAYIRISEDVDGGMGGGRSRSRSRSRGRSPSPRGRSPGPRPSRSRSRSRSPMQMNANRSPSPPPRGVSGSPRPRSPSPPYNDDA